MICETCGGTEVYIEEGVEYCKECSSQILGSRDEEASEDSFSKKSLLSSPSATKKKIKKKKGYLPWTTIEAYNYILSRQVSALIDLGCSERLKTVILCLWGRYLKKIQVAFKTENKMDDQVSFLGSFTCERDVQLLCGDGSFKSNRKSGLKNPKHRQDSNEAIKKEELITDDPSEKFEDSYESADTSASSEEIDSENDSDVFSDSSIKVQMKKLSKRSKNAQKHVPSKKKDFKIKRICCRYMSLSKTLSFLQLGLLYTEDQVQLFDLIRLVNEDKIPYINVSRHFPSSMQFQASDRIVFDKWTSPSMKSISLTTVRLFQFLDLPKFRHPPLLPFAVRFVKDLNLPNDFIPAVKILIDRFEGKRGEWYIAKKVGISCNSIPLYEVQAMSFIIVALKMLFVLDDHFEIEHSEVMKKLNAVETDNNFFVWSDWKNQMCLKEYLFLKQGSNINKIESLCADRIINDYSYFCLKSGVDEHAKDMKKEQKARTVIKNILEPLFINSNLKNKTTSFPLKYQLHRLMTEWENLPLYKETKEINFDFISKDFSCQRLFHSSSSASDSGEIIQLLLSSLYEKDVVFDGDLLPHKLVKTTKNYWCKTYKYKILSSDTKETWLEDLPKSFNWLLKLLCKYLQTNHVDMYLEIQKIEQNCI